MLALRYAGVLALTVWVGGLLVLGAIGGAVDLRRPGGAARGRTTACSPARSSARSCAGFTCSATAAGSFCLTTLLARGVLGPRPRRFAVAPRHRVPHARRDRVFRPGRLRRRSRERRRRSAAAPSSLPEGDPRRVAFGGCTRRPPGCSSCRSSAGLILLFRELKD